MKTVDIESCGTSYQKATKNIKRRIVLCGGTGCVANGALKVYDALQAQLEKTSEEIHTTITLEKENCGVHLSQSGCHGFCQMGPLVIIYPEEIVYVKVKPQDCEEIVTQTIENNHIIERLLYVDPQSSVRCATEHEIPFYNKQQRFVLKNCGTIDPEDIHEYIAHNGYHAAKDCFLNRTGENICEEMILSGLRGRGGGGFSTGKKWAFARIEKSDKKYVICNGDEGDPGAFMDRSLMEGNPHAVIEGMMIAARAIGSDEGYIYVRAEYPLAVKRMKKAIGDAQKAGLLGDDIFGSGHSFHLHIMEGAGAFVCGEETALISSIEGKRGMPMPKPPFPAQSGLFGKPTIINNVETLASVPIVMRIGSNKFRAIGTEKAPGTKTFALTGHVANTGLIEVPMGTSLRKIVMEIGGGVLDDSGKLTNNLFKAVQIGGPSGGCLTKDHLDLPLDFDSLQSVGAMVGSGGLVVMNNETCIVSVAKFFMQFTQNESCGKCVLCREGTKQMLSLLDDITEGRATVETLELLEKLGTAIKLGSLCALGKTAPNPVLSTMKHFRAEYEAHVFHKKCPTGRCKALMKPEISPALCKGCTMCVKVCPVGAITGEKKAPHIIDADKCIKCGACKQTCKFKAITGV